jgi:uncharacterized repeat protein (TIGR03803 family)
MCIFRFLVSARHSILVLSIALAALASSSLQAQTLTVLHTFTGAADGASPAAGLIVDRGGNFYGTAAAGAFGYGTAFKLTRKNSSWIFSTLHQFAAGTDGAYPSAPLYILPSGALLGTTAEGGGSGNCYYDGCGTIFQLQPPPTACGSVQCPWGETIIYRFPGNVDGAFPSAPFIVDSSGILYGEALGGTNGQGIVYTLQSTGRSWVTNTLYDFTGGNDGSSPQGGLARDSDGNLYGVTNSGGGYSEGTVFKLSLSGSSWVETTLHAFVNGYSNAGLIFDTAGNLYGDAEYGGCCLSGLVFELTPSGGGWAYSELHDFSGGYQGPGSTLVMDLQGNLYGTTLSIGAHNRGNIFKLSPSNGSWIYTDLYDFTGETDGGEPIGQLGLDSEGNIYGVASEGGQVSACDNLGCGVIYEFTP